MSSLLQGVDLWLVDSLVMPASLHDVDGRFLHMNAAAERASGRSNAYFLGRPLTYLLPPEARGHVDTPFRRAVEGGEPTDFETVFIDVDGQLRGVRAQHLPLRSGDAIVGVLILAFAVGSPRAAPLSRGLQPRLTPRQRQVLELIASGLSTKQIAVQLILSTETVRNHVRSLLRELQAHNRPEAIAAARRLGLLAPLPLGPQPSEPDAQTR